MSESHEELQQKARTESSTVVLNTLSMTCSVLYVIGQLRPGGTERQLYYLLQTIDRERYRPVVVVWNGRENNVYAPLIQALGVPAAFLPPRAFSSRKAASIPSPGQRS